MYSDKMKIDEIICENDIGKIVFENTSEGIVIADHEGNILWINKAFSAITGYAMNEVMGKNPRILKSNRHDSDFYKNMWKTLKEKGHWEGEIWNRRKNKEVYPEWLLIKAIKDSTGQTVKYVSLFKDLSKKHIVKDYKNYKNDYDALTDLPNRYLLKDRLEILMGHATRHKEKFAVIFLDIDRFKRINDTLGYNVGDKLLKSFSDRLKTILGKEVTIARQGGDEFVILFEHVAGPKDIINVIEKIFNQLHIPFKLKDYEIYVTVSVGVSVYPHDGQDIDKILTSAEVAMYRAKENGRNNYELYEPVMTETISEQLKIENNMRNALENNEFYLNYQPQVCAKTGKVKGAEALVRWNDEELGFISPAKFIPLAEEIGFILPLGQWILEKAIKDSIEFIRNTNCEFQISVNISAVQLRDDALISQVDELLKKYNFSPKNLELEITETHIMSDPKRVREILDKLKTMGIKIAIDDFGTGYSSLAYFKDFNVDKLKIDRSFIMDIMNDTNSQAVVLAMIDMAKRLKLTSLAEGVETEEELQYLKDNGCQLIQGYYTGKPMDKDNLIKMIQKCG